MTMALPVLSPPHKNDDLAETYSYGYPHKSLYRTLTPPVPLAPLWADEQRDSLALYVHIPFCEMRCGFCNLFTLARPDDSLIACYISHLLNQADAVKQFLSPAGFAECAIGGGTPTILSPAALELLLSATERLMGLPLRSVPTSVETSPATATPDRLAVLRAFGVRRISVGIQATSDDDLAALGRPGAANESLRALERLIAVGFPVVNADLIYGFAGQTLTSWRHTVRAVIARGPQELFLYPLYIRPGTGLGRRGDAAQRRRDLYRLGAGELLAAGYRQRSLRNFILPSAAAGSTRSCQRDGMLGLGCGARSYTERLHYSTPFAVAKPGIELIISDWLADESTFHFATHGIHLSGDERRRRHVILSLLDGDGLADAEYSARFGESPLTDFPQLASSTADGWLNHSAGLWRLTDLGLERSDELGLTFYSPAACAALSAFLQSG